MRGEKEKYVFKSVLVFKKTGLPNLQIDKLRNIKISKDLFKGEYRLEEQVHRSHLREKFQLETDYKKIGMMRTNG